VQDLNEDGVPGVTVYLIDAAGDTLATDTTDAMGAYGFDELAPGDYSIDFDLATLPAGYVVSPQDAGTDDAKDSDGDPSTGQTIQTTLDPGEDDPRWDLGINLPPAALGDYVWYDDNRDGIQDPTEIGVPDMIVYLLNPNDSNAVVRIDTTDAGGKYFFGELDPGDYIVFFDDLPQDYVVSPQNQGTNDSLDSDADVATRVTQVISLDPGETDTTWDMGINIPPASLGDYVWLDENGNGQQDSSEMGVPNVLVYLLDSTGAIIDSTSTDPTGRYGFDALDPGTYSVQFVAPAGYAITAQDQGDDKTDSDADPITGQTAPTTLDPLENDPTLDAGLYLPAALGDYTWIDANNDGIQDPSELGINGVPVYLLDAAGMVLDSTTTANNGSNDGAYFFEDLAPGVMWCALGSCRATAAQSRTIPTAMILKIRMPTQRPV
jgi:hypothetical protein